MRSLIDDKRQKGKKISAVFKNRHPWFWSGTPRDGGGSAYSVSFYYGDGPIFATNYTSWTRCVHSAERNVPETPTSGPSAPVQRREADTHKAIREKLPQKTPSAPIVRQAEQEPTAELKSEAAKFASFGQKAPSPKLRVLYLRKAIEKDPTNQAYKKMLNEAQAELARQPD